MASTKRQRQRENRTKAQQASAVVQEQVGRKKSYVKFAAIGGVIIVGLLIWAFLGDGGGEESVTITAEGKATTEDLLAWQQDAGSLDPEQRAQLYAQVGASPMVLDTSKNYVALITTENGEMRFELFDDEAPLTVNNFVNLADDGFYDGVSFHRVLDGFMAQGGDPSGAGSGSPGYQFVNEYTPGIEFDKRGQLAMANSGLDTNGSQYFITFNGENGLPASDYTIFGQLIDGDDVLSAISLRDPGSATTPGDIMTSVRIEVTDG